VGKKFASKKAETDPALGQGFNSWATGLKNSMMLDGSSMDWFSRGFSKELPASGNDGGATIVAWRPADKDAGSYWMSVIDRVTHVMERLPDDAARFDIVLPLGDVGDVSHMLETITTETYTRLVEDSDEENWEIPIPSTPSAA
jgi:hypothetical protein